MHVYIGHIRRWALGEHHRPRSSLPDLPTTIIHRYAIHTHVCIYVLSIFELYSLLYTMYNTCIHVYREN